MWRFLTFGPSSARLRDTVSLVWQPPPARRGAEAASFASSKEGHRLRSKSKRSAGNHCRTVPLELGPEMHWTSGLLFIIT